MGFRTWTITFTADFKDPQKHEVMRTMAKEACRSMLATATMLTGDGETPAEVEFNELDFIAGRSNFNLDDVLDDSDITS